MTVKFKHPKATVYIADNAEEARNKFEEIKENLESGNLITDKEVIIFKDQEVNLEEISRKFDSEELAVFINIWLGQKEEVK